MNAPKTKIVDVTAKVGKEIAVPVETNGYEDVISLTLSIRYHPHYLEYVKTKMADEFDVPGGEGMLLINDYLLNGDQGFRCVAVGWYRIGPTGIKQKSESVLQHVFRAKNPGNANLVFIDKTAKNPQTVCEWGAVEVENGQIVSLYPMPEPVGTYVGGTVTITE